MSSLSKMKENYRELYIELAREGLTLKQYEKRFLEAYAMEGRILPAAKKAGWKGVPRTIWDKATKLLAREDAKAYLKDATEALRREQEVSRDYVTDKLKSIIERKDIKVSDQINAIQLLAKLMGIIKDTPESDKVVVLQTVGLQAPEPQQTITYTPPPLLSDDNAE